MLVALLAGLAGGAGACTVDDVTFSAPSAPVITSFTASKRLMVRGSGAQLVAEFDGDTATIDPGVGEVASGQPVTVDPAESTVYTLTVSRGGDSLTATLAIQVVGGIIEVSNPAAEGANTLYSAVALANRANGDSLAITFNLPLPAVLEPPGTLVLDSSAELLVLGPGADQLSLSGGGARRLFFVRRGKVAMSGLTLAAGVATGGQGGRGIGGGSGGGAAGMGGALFINGGDVALRDVVFADNVARGGAGGPGGGGGLANGGGGGGFGGPGADGGTTSTGQGGPGGAGGELGGQGGAPGQPGTGDGAGGGGAGAGLQQNGGAGSFGAGGGGSGGFPNSGAGGFGGGAGGGANPSPGPFGGTASPNLGGGGAGLGGAIFLRAGTLAITASAFRNNQSLGGTSSAAGAAFAGKAKAGAIFSLGPTPLLTDVTFAGSVAADALATPTDNPDLFVMPPPT